MSDPLSSNSMLDSIEQGRVRRLENEIERLQRELAKAEIERAKGVAGANSIIADSLKGNEAYLRYLWITQVAAVGKEGKTVVYVPTEANLPILEATRQTR